MINSELLKGIEEDELLKEMKITLEVARKNAEMVPVKAELREAELYDKLNNYRLNVIPVDSYDMDEIEKLVDGIESKESIARKLVAIRNLKSKNWTLDRNYREAMAQYYTYIVPILTELEVAKQESRDKIASIRDRYNKELSEARKEYDTYENKAMKLLDVPKESCQYIYGISFNSQFNRLQRADSFAAARSKFYQTSLAGEKSKGSKTTTNKS